MNFFSLVAKQFDILEKNPYLNSDNEKLLREYFRKEIQNSKTDELYLAVFSLFTLSKKLDVYTKFSSYRDSIKVMAEALTEKKDGYFLISIEFITNETIIKTSHFSNNELDYRIKISSNDEIGQLESSFNEMASKIENLIKKEKEINENLEKEVDEEKTKQKEQEQILIQKTRLAAMGEMIGNIAHQWRQPLNALGLVLQNLKFSYEMGDLNDDVMNRSMDKANMLTKNMSKTIDDFRNFFKQNKAKEIFDINKSVIDSMALVESTFEYHKIKLEKDFKSEKIEIFGFPNEFAQVLLNIISNAKDALLENKIKNPQVKIETKIEDDNAYIFIIDNALGIKEDAINKIFEPYFTTKNEVQGTGIGLYMSKIIIERNMNGQIYAKNKDDGAIFTIKLPLKNE